MVHMSSQVGAYSREISSRHIFQLGRQATKKRLVSAHTKGFLNDLMPKNVNVTRQHVFNMRVKVTQLLSAINNNPDYAAFKNYVNNGELMYGIDNELQVNDDMPNKMATQLWMDVLAEKNTHLAVAQFRHSRVT